MQKAKNKYQNIGTVQRKSIYLDDDSESSKNCISNKLINQGFEEFEEFEKPIEENKEQRLFGFEINSDRNPRYS